MAISLLQDAQARSLAAALAGMQQRENVDTSLNVSPSMTVNTTANTSMYPGMQHAAAASAFMLSPTQLLAANRQAAAAFMAQLPMSTLASTLFPHHPASLFGSWAAGSPSGIHLGSSAPHSPPASPHSPITVHTPQAQKHNLSESSPTGTHSEVPAKKARKMPMKKHAVSPQIEISMSVNDLYHTTGPISPPSSGSSPNSSSHEVSSPANNINKDGGTRDKSFTCKICSRSFGYKHVLQNHERTHTGEKPFECPECHKRFTRDHHLKTHMRLHTGEKPYHCSHCDRQFVQVANLRRHLRVHTGERPYTCEICEGKFSDSNQLKSHMLVHNGEKPFECEKCHMKFRRRHHLMNHKCGVQSPVTPILSPAMSNDFLNCDQKSFYSSEESIEMGKPLLNQNGCLNYGSLSQIEDEAPLDLSEDASSQPDEFNSQRCRKPNDIRRVFRLPPPQIMHIPTDMPEQTEPEDLSIRSSRQQSNTSPTARSPQPNMLLIHEDLALDELDVEANLYMRPQHYHHYQQKQHRHHQQHLSNMMITPLRTE